MRKTKSEINYETLGRISEIISSAQDMADVAQHVVQQLTQAMHLKGAALMILDRKTRRLEVAASYGLSDQYLQKGPISATKSIADSLTEGPVGVWNVADDPRIQYPEQAVAEGIKSIMSVPLRLRGKALGCLRLYTAEHWEFSMQDFTFVQAIAELIALSLENIRITKAYKTSIEVLKVLRPAQRPYRSHYQR